MAKGHASRVQNHEAYRNCPLWDKLGNRKTFTCAWCNGVFNKEWTDEEAREELEENFPDTPVEECDLVCDNCYDELNRKIKIMEN